MSTNTATRSAYASRTARRLAGYLRAEAERADGDFHVTARGLAAESDLSPDRARQLLADLRGAVPGLTVEPRSSSPETVWRVSVA